MLTIWGRRDSSNVQALMWCVGELGLPHRRHDAGHRFGGTDTPAFRAMNPNGLVPVLVDGDGEPLWETGAILLYKIPRVVIGENSNFVGGEDLLRNQGVEVIVVDDTECKALMKKFIDERPEARCLTKRYASILIV